MTTDTLEQTETKSSELPEFLNIIHEWLKIIPGRELFSADECMNYLLDIQQAAIRFEESHGNI